ncbi:MAG: dienelactone hydrolase family protein [Proteobacteria bacterium]|nr:dienelactone hydrolase family protein [Pseudomonadota bacterium]
MSQQSDEVAVEGGAVPVYTAGPEEPLSVPGLVVVPSIFGPAPDLLERISGLADVALTVVADPFWRVGGGAFSYEDHEGARSRLRGFDRDACLADIRAVIAWTGARCNGRVVGLGICFGGPVMLVAAGEGLLSGLVAWHGSRMEGFLDRAGEIRCPVRFHFGAADPVTPPEAIEKIRAAFADHPDASFVIHPDAVHGFSHDGAHFDPVAAQSGVDDTRTLLASL